MDKKHKQQRPIPYKAPESSMLHCNSQSISKYNNFTILFHLWSCYVQKFIKRNLFDAAVIAGAVTVGSVYSLQILLKQQTKKNE